METNELVYADRSKRGKLRFTGPQRGWFLHQIMTQAFEDMTPGEARDTAMITAHGRMLGYMEVVATQDALLAHFEAALLASLPDAIRRYVFATRVEIDDVTAERGLILVAGPGCEQVAGRVEGSVLHATASLGVPAVYLWVPAAGVAGAVGRLEEVGARQATEQELEEVRIANRVPRWGYEMDLKTIPQEAGIEERAVHFDKGCYVGQEAMAKIHFRGKVNRRLALIHSDREIEPGDEVVAEGATVGKVTSAAGDRGLAIVKRTVEPDAVVSVGDALAAGGELTMAHHYEGDDLIVRKIGVGNMGNNVYVLECPETHDAFIVDGCFEPDTILDGAEGANVVGILQTHGHMDHVQALPGLVARLSVPVYAHPGDSYPVAIDHDLADGAAIDLGNRTIRVLHTPGHTPGGVCFHSGRHLVSGDTLFPGGPGNTWGNADAFAQIIGSIETKLFVLPDDTFVYPGHGDDTTIGAEKPHLQEWRDRGW